MSDGNGQGASAELLSLASGYCHDTLSAEEFARLEELLSQDAAARAHFRRYLGLDAALREYGDSAAGAWQAGLPQRAGRVPGRWNRAAQLAGVAVMALIAMAAVWAMIFNQQVARATTVGMLEEVAGDVRILGADGQVRAIASNAPVAQGDTVRTRGSESSTVVAYPDGTRLTLVGNTSVTCGDPISNSIVVHQGTLAAFVTPQPAESVLRLATPSAELEVLGTRFQVEALEHRTDLSVSEGRVRLVRTRDLTAVEVPEGKRASVTEQDPLEVQDIPGLAATWDEGFEASPPEGWDRGAWVTEGLPAGSRGAVKAVAGYGPEGVLDIAVKSNEDWLQGLFEIRQTSHLHFTFKMANPRWINVFFSTRTTDQDSPRFSGNYLFNEWPKFPAGEWQTASIPLAAFGRLHSGDVTLDQLLPFKFMFATDQEECGLVIDRIWITPDGPGEFLLQPAE